MYLPQMWRGSNAHYAVVLALRLIIHSTRRDLLTILRALLLILLLKISHATIPLNNKKGFVWSLDLDSFMLCFQWYWHRLVTRAEPVLPPHDMNRFKLREIEGGGDIAVKNKHALTRTRYRICKFSLGISRSPGHDSVSMVMLVECSG
jgi:hypothetical protein